MEYQAGLGQPWPQIGSYLNNANDQHSKPQGFDVETPSDLSESLNSPGASSSEVHSSLERSTKLTRTSDAAFHSEKGGLVPGCSDFNTTVWNPSNSDHGDMLPASILAPQMHSIDPRKILYEEAPEGRSSVTSSHQQASRLRSANATSKRSTGLASQMRFFPNDFDFVLEGTPMMSGNIHLNERAVSWLGIWISQNPGRLPPTKELKCLEILAGVPGRELMSWLKEHMIVGSKGRNNPLQRIDDKIHRNPRCLDSRPRKILSGEPRMFECTNGCGKTFPRHRKGDWARHERINFEQWACHLCADVLTRKEHLQKHVKLSHKVQDIDLEKHKFQLLDSVERPCGFCGRSLPTWKAWLSHVADHFEDRKGGQKRKMSEWQERKGRALEPGKQPHSASRHNDTNSDDDNEDDDDKDDGDEDDGDGYNSDGGAGAGAIGGGSVLNSSYKQPWFGSGVDTDNGAGYSFDAPYTMFSNSLLAQTSQEDGRRNRSPSSHPIEHVAVVHHMQELGVRMAALELSETGIESACGPNANVPDSDGSQVAQPAASEQEDAMPKARVRLADKEKVKLSPGYRGSHKIRAHRKQLDRCGAPPQLVRWLDESAKEGVFNGFASIDRKRDTENTYPPDDKLMLLEIRKGFGIAFEERSAY